MKVAYADPPYPGESRRHYRDHPDYDGEVDHARLIRDLEQDFPEGWALSTKVPALRDLLNLCHEAGADDVRVAAWVKPWFVMKPGMGVGYAWEPVIWRGGRKRTRRQDTVRDWISANAVMRSSRRVQTKGQKPEQFCYWLFAVLNLQPGDEFVDMFPGSGAVTHAWARWQTQMNLPQLSPERQSVLEDVA